MKSKVCTMCNIEKNLDDFHNQKRGKFGKASICKICNKKRNKIRRDKNNKLKSITYTENESGTKFCNLCKEEKSYSQFNKYRHAKDGHKSNCRSCQKKQGREYYSKNKEERAEYRREYYQENRDFILKQTKEYSKNNREHLTKKSKEWRHNNKDKCNATYAKRRASKLNATPKWCDSDKIKVLYEKAKWLETLTGLEYHVDHIVPLQNDNVCGLHVWHNLQILEKSENLKKSNKICLEKK